MSSRQRSEQCVREKQKPNNRLKLSVVKVFPCVLMFPVKTQLRGLRKKLDKITPKSQSVTPSCYQISLSPCCNFKHPGLNNIPALLQSLRDLVEHLDMIRTTRS